MATLAPTRLSSPLDWYIAVFDISRREENVPQELDLLSSMLNRADQINFDNKDEYAQALRSIATTQKPMYISDIKSLGNLFEALQHPQEIINSIRRLRTSAAKAEQSMRRSDMWWSGLSSIGGGAMTAFGEAGVAFGAVGNAATSALEAVSGTIASGGTGHQHTRSASEGVTKKDFNN
ncbi:MAG: hypothetical protein J3R72DRAFT_513059 [Linnemannia gamsii]|nr:MAG: hypothetical protein J3R72DRAFT_513059 [Linnemannia gamsii]